MLVIRIIALILWILAGILVLVNGKIGRLEYGIVWATLIVELIANLFN